MEPKIVIRFAVFFVISALLIFVGYKLLSVFVPFLFAYILRFALKPPVNLLEQRGLKHTPSVTIVFIVFFCILGIFLQIFLPAVLSELVKIQNNLPVYGEALNNKIQILQNSFLGKFDGVISMIGKDGQDVTEMIRSYVLGSVTELVKKMASIVISLLPMVLYIVIIPFATFFFLLDEHLIKKSFISIVPNRYFESAVDLLYRLNRQFGLLLGGMLITAVIMSTLISTLLWTIGLEFPILVGVFSGVANLIPYAGPIVGMLAAFLIAIMVGSPGVLFLYIMLVFLMANLIENVVIQPVVLAKAANLHPLSVIFLILVGSKLGGVFGMLLAVPIASLLQVTMKIIISELTRPVKPDFTKLRLIATLKSIDEEAPLDTIL